jgi:hypothetical protein
MQIWREFIGEYYQRGMNYEYLVVDHSLRICRMMMAKIREVRVRVGNRTYMDHEWQIQLRIKYSEDE